MSIIRNMKKMSIPEYLKTFGVKDNFFKVHDGLLQTWYDTKIDFEYHNGKKILGFVSQNKSFLSKMAKQPFLPLKEVFPENRKKIMIYLYHNHSENNFSGDYSFNNYFGRGTNKEVINNYKKAKNEVSKIIHKKIGKKVSEDNEDYDYAFNEELEDFSYIGVKEVFEKYKIYDSESEGNIERFNDYGSCPDGWSEEVFGDFRKVYFHHEYTDSLSRSIDIDNFFLLDYKKNKYIIDVHVLEDCNLMEIKI